MTSLNWPCGIGLRSSNSTALTAASSGTLLQRLGVVGADRDGHDQRQPAPSGRARMFVEHPEETAAPRHRRLGMSSEQLLGLIHREHQGG